MDSKKKIKKELELAEEAYRERRFWASQQHFEKAKKLLEEE